ncbi:MAG: IclR family transcriptional regulator [Deltaproteobacteria bacterium]|nr:IclR family transcriptional regulator [Deltaproteobacteria bacterium]
MVRREKSNYIIRSVSHALDVLEQFFGDADELGVTELSTRLKLHKNNIFRLLATLESRGYIEQNKATENYRLGLRSLHLGQAYVSRMGLLRQARPVMEGLVKHAHESTYVAVARPGGMVPLAGVEADQPVRVVSTIGETLPLHATAVGKTQLAFATEEEQKTRLPETLKRFTAKTVTERSALLQQLKAAVENGYTVDAGEHVDDVRAVAAPIKDYTGRVVGALAISGPAYRLTAERMQKEFAPLVVKAGQDLSGRLGFHP